ncbi:hypothetical protein [Thermogutta sp.]|uniref:hypothetical protein n=1 Tax=Thermogutta sp. TaxID=1962930 RepID=UPI0032208E38
MASPFKIFRKNAKVLLVGLFLLSMVSFVVIPSFLQWLQTQRSRTAGVVVSTVKFGNLSEVQLASLRRERAVVRRFLEALMQRIEELKGNSFRVRLALMTIDQPTEENLVRSWLIAQYARQTGLKVTDQSVNAFLRSLIDASGVPLSQSDLVNLMRSRNIDENVLFAGLEHELLVLRYMQLAGLDLLSLQPGLTGETPGARWDYFLRLNRMASVELCDFPVEKYIDQVPAPDERTVRAFFDEYKTRLPNPQSPEPGFKVPNKVTLEYLKADFQKWLLNTKIPEEELRRVYEERKDDLFVRPAPPPTEATSTSPSESGQTAGNPSSGGSPQGSPESTQAPSAGTEKPPASSTPTSEQSAPQGSPSPTETPSQPAEQSQPKAEQGTSEPQGQSSSGTSEPQPTQGSRDESRLKVLFTAFEPAPENLQEKAPEKEEQPQKPEQTSAGPSETPPVASPASAASTEEKPQPGDSAKEKPAEAPATAPQTPASEPQPASQTQSPAASAQTPSQQPAAESSKYRPFEEVKDQVRSLIISERIKAVLDEIEEIMRQYQGDLANYEAAKEEAERAKQPEPAAPSRPDLRKLAQEKGLDYFIVENAAIWDLADRDIGKAFDLSGAPVLQSVFDLAEFLTLRAVDQDSNQYLAWVTAKVKEHVPTLDEPGVREQVIHTWRMQEARKLAEKEVQALAEKVNAARQSLADFYKASKQAEPAMDLPEPVESEPFTWLTYGEFDLARLTRTPPRISPIKIRVKDPASGLIVEKDAVQDAGNEFMAAVFSLDVGQAGLAWNRPHTVVYLVRVLEFQPPMEQLFERFMRDTRASYLDVVQFDLATIYQGWIQNLEKEAGLKWIHPAGSGVPLD